MVKGGVCIRHGEKKKCCREGCTNNSVKGGVCIRHGAKLKHCSSEGCANNAQKGGVCVQLGAMRRKRCSSDECVIKSPQEARAKDMGQRSLHMTAPLSDAQTKLR